MSKTKVTMSCRIRIQFLRRQTQENVTRKTKVVINLKKRRIKVSKPTVIKKKETNRK